MKYSTEANFNLIMDFSKCDSYDNAKDDASKLMPKYIDPEKEYTVVIVNHVDNVGVIESSDVYISPSYVMSANLIASYEYSKNVSVEVLSLYDNLYAHIKYKTYDGVCYSSFACCTASTYNILAFIRKLYDTNAKVHVAV